MTIAHELDELRTRLSILEKMVLMLSKNNEMNGTPTKKSSSSPNPNQRIPGNVTYLRRAM